MVEIKQKPRLHASWIDPDAKDIVRALQNSGYKTYLVGGCVRDLLAGLHPKDYDIATSAEPNQVRRKIYGSYVIGRRFRLVLVKREDRQYEVATFRRPGRPEDAEEGEEGKEVTGDNFFGTPQEDALRRDFTINALFYDPIKDELIDYAEGMKDIESHTLRVIGEPNARIIEDPIRSLRAIRLSHKLKFQIEKTLREAIMAHAGELVKSAAPRRREEFLKFLRLHDPAPAFCELHDLGLMEAVLPSLKIVFDDHDMREVFLSFIHRIEEVCVDKGQPVELYTPVVMGFLRALENHPQKEELLTKLMRDDLGIFKAEQVSIFTAMEMADNLPEIESFKRRGLRRRQAFLHNEFLPLALRIGKFEHHIPPHVLTFWEQGLLNPARPQSSDHKDR